MRQTKQIKLNLAQIATAQATQKYISLELGRGTGKSTILAYGILKAVRELPRGTGILVGNTFTQILSNTWPSTKAGLALFGLYEDIHFVVGKCGKNRGFKMPIQSPNNWLNSIHFYSGFILVLVSLQNPNSGRGLNSSVVFGDEAALFDHKKLFNQVQNTNRVDIMKFRGSNMNNAEWYTSSTPRTLEGRWFLDFEKKAKKKPDKYFHLRANAYCNLMNLADGWIERQRENSMDITQFRAEILNIRPHTTAVSFYPQLSTKKHYYAPEDHHDMLPHGLSDIQQDAALNWAYCTDYRKELPLIISIDWGAQINSLTVSQYDGKHYQIVKEFFVKSPDIIDDLIHKFNEFHIHYPTRVIELYYDRNGNNKTPNSRLTYAEQVQQILESKNWKIKVKTPRSLDPSHDSKFQVINQLLKNSGEYGWPTISINKMSCQNTIVSMENAPAKEKPDNSIIKDKSSERNKNMSQELATHLSDTVDFPLYWMFHKLVKNKVGKRRGYAIGIS